MKKLMDITLYSNEQIEHIQLPTEPQNINNIKDKLDTKEPIMATTQLLDILDQHKGENRLYRSIVTRDVQGYIQSIKEVNLMLMLDYDYLKNLNNASKNIFKDGKEFNKYSNLAAEQKDEHIANIKIASELYTDNIASKEYTKLLARVN